MNSSKQIAYLGLLSGKPFTRGATSAMSADVSHTSKHSLKAEECPSICYIMYLSCDCANFHLQFT
jgi:hypothetical protein